jgi:hypothetical protein
MEMKPKKELGTGRVAFLARKNDIKERIDSGRTSMSVYREYQKQIDISYSQFARYVVKFIRSKPDENQGKQSAAQDAGSGDKGATSKPEYGPPKFRQSENRDDLIHPKPKE